MTVQQKREDVKNLIGEINHQYPGAKARMIRAVLDDVVNVDKINERKGAITLQQPTYNEQITMKNEIKLRELFVWNFLIFAKNFSRN